MLFHPFSSAFFHLKFHLMIYYIVVKYNVQGDFVKKFLKNKWVKYTLIEWAAGIILVLLLLLYQNRSDLLGWTNGILVSGFLLVAFGWLLFINNEGLFDILIYGTQYFLKSLIGRRMSKSYYETVVDKKKTPAAIYITLWINGIIFILISLIYYIF